MKITTGTVVRSVEPTVKKCIKSLEKDEAILHKHGYHQFSTDVANMRYAIEVAFNELIDKLIEEHG